MSRPEIQRVNAYDDRRFSPIVLRQHGAFLVDGQPYEVEITGPETAVIRGESWALYPEVIELFRFYAGHISKFYDTDGRLVMECPAVKLFPVKLRDIQPSQFYVDQDKLAAVGSFIHGSEDIVVPLVREGESWLSADGHTRLALAVERGYEEVRGFADEDSEYIHGFAAEARNRGVRSPYDLKKLPHEEYKVKWDQFCDDYFAALESADSGGADGDAGKDK